MRRDTIEAQKHLGTGIDYEKSLFFLRDRNILRLACGSTLARVDSPHYKP